MHAVSAAAVAKAAAAAGVENEQQQAAQDAAQNDASSLPIVHIPLHSVWIHELTPDALELVRAIQKREDARTKRKVTAATGNGKQLRLSLGVNVVAALQRNERLGRSSEGVVGGGVRRWR